MTNKVKVKKYPPLPPQCGTFDFHDWTNPYKDKGWKEKCVRCDKVRKAIFYNDGYSRMGDDE